MRARLVGLSVLLAACASAPEQPATGRSAPVPPAPVRPPPIAGPEEIVILPDTTIGLPLLSHVGLRPAGTSRLGKGAVLVVAFVVDTVGRAELATVRFIETTPTDLPQYFLSIIEREYQQSVCEYLSRARFTPALVDGRPRRKLVVEGYVFRRSYFGADSRLARYTESLRQASRDEVFDYLNGLPAC
jgi:hypothetical protein